MNEPTIKPSTGGMRKMKLMLSVLGMEKSTRFEIACVFILLAIGIIGCGVSIYITLFSYKP